MVIKDGKSQETATTGTDDAELRRQRDLYAAKLEQARADVKRLKEIVAGFNRALGEEVDGGGDVDADKRLPKTKDVLDLFIKEPDSARLTKMAIKRRLILAGICVTGTEAMIRLNKILKRQTAQGLLVKEDTEQGSVYGQGPSYLVHLL